MKFLQRSLAARLPAVFLLLVIAPLVVIGLLAYNSGRRSIISNVEAHLVSVAILKEQEIQNWVTHLEHTPTRRLQRLPPPKRGTRSGCFTRDEEGPYFQGNHCYE
jgi:hypothetical protein